MATQSSFDVTSTIDFQEVDNALNQARKEVGQRYDFKGARADIELNPTEKKLTLTADDEFKMNALWEIVQTRLVRRGVPVKNFKATVSEPAAGGTVRRVIDDSAGDSHRSGARDREVHQGQETEEGAGVDPGRSGPRELAVEGRAPGSDAPAARARLRRRAAVRKPSMTLANSTHQFANLPILTSALVFFSSHSTAVALFGIERENHVRQAIRLPVDRHLHLVGDLFLRRGSQLELDAMPRQQLFDPRLERRRIRAPSP